MKTDSFWGLIPKGVKIAATLVFVCALIAGPLIVAVQGDAAGLTHPNGIPAGVLAFAIGLGAGLVVGAFVAFWLLSLGYVYADSRRRAMPCVLWVLVCIFVPNLLGFLLYFALRRPLGSPCSNCGNLIAHEQRFCSWCGNQYFAPPPPPSGLSSTGSRADSVGAV